MRRSNLERETIIFYFIFLSENVTQYLIIFTVIIIVAAATRMSSIIKYLTERVT